MSVQGDCPGCERGDHAAHDPAWGTTFGLLSGEFCGCTGNCAERLDVVADALMHVLLDDWPTGPDGLPDTCPAWMRTFPAPPPGADT